MPVEWDPSARQWHLHNPRLSVVLAVLENGSIGQLYLGAALASGRDYRHLARGPFTGFDNRVGDPVRFELPTPDSGDYRLPALAVRHADGSQVLDLRYQAHRILAGKPELPGLPTTYTEDAAEADTLEIDLLDAVSGLASDRPADPLPRPRGDRPEHQRPKRGRRSRPHHDPHERARWTSRTVTGSSSPSTARGRASGTWSRAAHPGSTGHREPAWLLEPRAVTVPRPGPSEHHRGCRRGHRPQPRVLRRLPGRRPARPLRHRPASPGLHPDSFDWLLEPGATFTSPEAVTVHSVAGLGDMSETFHRLFRTRLARGEWRDRQRPVLLNNWEGTYFDFDEERLVAIASVARDLGVELFVLDDGWFGTRDSDDRPSATGSSTRASCPTASAGWWSGSTALGIDFGIWIEPEMVNADSDLFRAHPDWAIGVPGRPRTESRQQLVLDLGRAEVVDYLYDALEAVLASAPISYVKWDMNRTMTETYGLGLPPDRQGEMRHRYILGVYELYQRLTSRFPHILFESCSSGGGRFDAGMLAYAPRHGRATTPTRWSGCGSSGAPPWCSR